MLERVELWPDGVPGALGDGAEDRPHLLRLVPEKDRDSGAAVIVCPGGGYVRRADHEGEPVARWLASLGLHAFVLHYRVSPYRHPYPLADAYRAVRLVRSRAPMWGYDANKIAMLGFSAGAHLTASAAILDADNQAASYGLDEPASFSAGKAGDDADQAHARPDRMILCYPVISMQEHRHQGSHDHLLGENPAPELQQRYTLDKQVNPQTPPAFIWHTSDDDGVPVENSLRLAAALSRHQIPFEYHSFESGRHGLGLAQDHPEAYVWTQLCEAWLHKQGWLL